jgi:hypothetical protein
VYILFLCEACVDSLHQVSQCLAVALLYGSKLSTIFSMLSHMAPESSPSSGPKNPTSIHHA